jgi:6,7-dimethyl-8-ribityllumazine synthase
MSNRRDAIPLKGKAGSGLRVAIAVAAFNREYTARLLESASRRLKGMGATTRVAWVPGAFELGIAARELASTHLADAVVCLGAVIRGDTSHYDLVCNAAADGILRAGMDTGVPVIFGVITCDTPAQALQRCSGGSKDAGVHAAEAAVHMSNLLRSIRHGN